MKYFTFIDEYNTKETVSIDKFKTYFSEDEFLDMMDRICRCCYDRGFVDGIEFHKYEYEVEDD